MQKPYGLSQAFVASMTSVILIGTAAADPPILLNQAALLNTTISSGTATQQVIPNPLYRASTLEGGGTAPFLGVAPNPVVTGGRECTPVYYSGVVDLRTAGVVYSATDLALPTAGVPLVIGRVHNTTQGEPSKPWVSDGYQGRNWFQTALPEIVLEGSSTVYFVGASGMLEYQRVGSSELFRGVNGAPGVFQRTAADANNEELYTLHEPTGRKMQFYGGTSGAPNWQLWKITNPDGKRLYAGDPNNSKTSGYSGGYSSGKVTTLIQEQGSSADERKYVFTYATFGGGTRLDTVEVFSKSGGSFSGTAFATVDYDYYTTTQTIAANTGGTTDDDDGLGMDGDLKTVVVTLPLGGGINDVRTSYYRYYTNPSWSATYPETKGYQHCLKTVLEPEGYRRAAAAAVALSTTVDATTTDNLKSYSAAFFFYANSSTDPRRIENAFFNGECGCGGGPNGLTSFLREENSSYSGSKTTGYDSMWFSRTVVGQPDGTYQTRYFDEAGQPMGSVITPSLPSGTSITNMWATLPTRDSNGHVNEVWSPASLTSYNHTTGAITTGSTGLVTTYTRNSSSSSHLYGFITAVSFQDGTGTATKLNEYSYDTRADTLGTGADKADITRPVVTQQKTAVKLVTGTYTWETVDYNYLWWSNSSAGGDFWAVKAIKTTYPAVATADNGENTAQAAYTFLRKDGRVAFTQGLDGVVNATLYNEKGLSSQSIRDVDTSASYSYESIYEPGDFAYPTAGTTPLASSGTELEYSTEYTYDTVGRSTLVELPSGRYTGTYYSRLYDGRLVTISFPEVVGGASPTDYKGPATYSVSNHAGRVELSATLGTGTVNLSSTPIADWVDESSSDPLDNLDADLRGSDRSKVKGLRTTIYDSAGAKATESRAYFSISTSGTGGAWVGSSSVYDPTTYTYDDMGRVKKTIDPTGTISRTMFDALGRVSSQWVGTSDTSWPPVAATSAAGNMTQVAALEYDGNASKGNNHLTKLTRFVVGDAYGFGSSTDWRVTTNTYDVRGNLKVLASPVKPYTVTDYDLRRRVTATAGYSSTSGLSATSDTTSATNRVTLAKTFYDSRGQVYKTSRHNIDQSDGSDDDNLETLLWRDAAGRVIKEGGDRNSKQVYDRFGRIIRRFELARNNDSGYSDADDVIDDHVLTEIQTLYDNETKTGNVMMSTSIARHHAVNSSGVTGELDTGYATPDYYDLQAGVSGAEVKGRIFITSYWYDSQDRPVATVPYGTNGNADYDRYSSGWGSVPTRSSTTLTTETLYDDFGQVSLIKSPRVVSSNPLKTRYLYDAAMRKIAEIRSDTGSDSTPTTLTSPTVDRDTDIYTRYTYVNGQMETMWVDIDGDNTLDSGDQVTTYSYGATKSGGTLNSAIASNRLLSSVLYPNGASSTTSDNTVTYAYNAQGQRITKLDQAGTTHAYTYDAGGRMLTDAVTLAGGSTVDNAVLRIATAYNDRGMVKTVTQYDAASSGTVTDEVAYAYDGWGLLSDYQQDNDGTVTGTGVGSGSNDYGVRYTTSKVSTTSGVSGTRRAALRRTATQLRFGSGTGAAYGSAVHGWRYEYLDSSAGDTLLDGDAGFLTTMHKTTDDGGSEIALMEYRYGGDGRVLAAYVVVPALMQRHYVVTGGDPYSPYLDQWGRVTDNQWMRGNGTVFRATPTYDEASNITSVPQHHTPYGAVYAVDKLNRLVGAQVGVVSSGSISGTVFAEEDWTAGGGGVLSLSQTGNWTNYVRSKDGSADLTTASTFNDNNQYAIRDISPDGNPAANEPSDYEVTYDKTGNLIDDDKPAGGRTESAYGFKYTYDAWNRLRKVYDGNGQSGALVKELRYNGLGHLIAEHVDTDSDTDVDGSDVWRHNQYNERWQLLSAWKGSDAKPSETYAHHSAGLNGFGGSSYIDDLICRDRDKDVDGSLVREERLYYIQNWRHDVVALIRADSATDCKIVERIRYDAYGRPTSFNPVDIARAGAVIGPDFDLDNNDDIVAVSGSGAQWYNDYGTGTSGTVYLPDGTKNGFDYTAFYDAWTDPNGDYGGGGWGVLSGPNIDNRVGYAGYRFDPTLCECGGANGKPVYHVRNRALDSTSGKWFEMDPAEYVDGMNLYQYCESKTVIRMDPTGLAAAMIYIPPIYSPMDPWNDWNVPNSGNCFRYVTGRLCRGNDRNPQLSPAWSPVLDKDTNINRCATCAELMAGIHADYGGVYDETTLLPDGTYTTACPLGYYKIAIFTDLNMLASYPCDIHFYRQERDGRWTDKPGDFGPFICSNPETENDRRNTDPVTSPTFRPDILSPRVRPGNGMPLVRGLPTFCGYMCLPNMKRR